MTGITADSIYFDLYVGSFASMREFAIAITRDELNFVAGDAFDYIDWDRWAADLIKDYHLTVVKEDGDFHFFALPY